ncbi:MAG TPA: tetratricopeptide repeat protein [Vicinamibacterales bacterium]|jgi:TolA-binding protein
MKRVERHHLKENELQTFARQARGAYEERKRETTVIVAVAVVIGAVAIGYFGWRESVQSKAHALLADAVVVMDAPISPPPAPGQPSQGIRFATERERAQSALTKLKATADAYPSTDAGLYARYQEGATWMVLGSPAQAATSYQQVIDRDGSGIYGQMARLGLAEAQAREGQYDKAIQTYQDLSQRKDGPLPIDGILMQLGRAYLDAGKRTEAQQTFNRLVEEFPDSPFNADAKRELDNLKKA